MSETYNEDQECTIPREEIVELTDQVKILRVAIEDLVATRVLVSTQ